MYMKVLVPLPPFRVVLQAALRNVPDVLLAFLSSCCCRCVQHPKRSRTHAHAYVRRAEDGALV